MPMQVDLRHLLRGVHGIVAAVVEEIPDIMRPKNVDQALVLFAILVDSGQFVARRPKGAARRMAQTANGCEVFLAGVDQIFGQCA
jgi:hypothetical protein